MKKKVKRQFMLVAFGVILYAALMNLGAVVSGIQYVANMIFPVLCGFILAFVLSVPMNAYERLLTKATGKMKSPMKTKLVSVGSLLLTLLSVALVILLVCTLVIPQLINSFKSLYDLCIAKWPEWSAMLREYDINTEAVMEWFHSLNFSQLLGGLTSNAGNIISSAVDIASSTVSRITSIGLALVIAIYVLLSKKDLARQMKKLLRAHLKESKVNYLLHVSTLVHETYSKFLSGQCVEACILGSLIFITFSIIGIPYAALTGVLTAVCAFIPYVGAFIACAVGAFLVLLANPAQVLVCVIAYLVVQFVENQFIYPHVVGTSVGLSPLWTLIAVLVGGNLMGLFGMIFFIPLTAVVITLLSEHTNKALQEKNGNK